MQERDNFSLVTSHKHTLWEPLHYSSASVVSGKVLVLDASHYHLSFDKFVFLHALLVAHWDVWDDDYLTY